MKKFYKLIFFFSLAALMSFTKEDCSTLKNNTYKYRYAKKDVLVVFKVNDYIEYHNNKEHFIKSDIEWISNCEYNLIIKETNLPDFPFKVGTKLNIKINKIRGKKVYYTSSLGGRTWEGRMTRVKIKN
ncbi:MAG: hypothetical protein AB8B78_06540 [Polaribacter sp.]